MTPELGLFALVLALLIAVVQAAAPLLMAGRKLSTRERILAAACVAAIAVFGAVGLYGVTTNFDVSAKEASSAAQPKADRLAADLAALATFATSDQLFSPERKGEPQAGLPTVEEMIQRLTARLSRNPRDSDGWRTLGWSYFNLGRFAQAADAYAKAITLSPGDAELKAARIEALVGSADGVVTADAKLAIAETLKLDPSNVQARFFTGLAKEQEGNKAGALADWNALLKDADSAEPWVADLKIRIAELSRDMGLDRNDSADAR